MMPMMSYVLRPTILDLEKSELSWALWMTSCSRNMLSQGAVVLMKERLDCSNFFYAFLK